MVHFPSSHKRNGTLQVKYSWNHLGHEACIPGLEESVALGELEMEEQGELGQELELGLDASSHKYCHFSQKMAGLGML